MKKLFTAILITTLVFALTIASSAAAVSAKWTIGTEIYAPVNIMDTTVFSVDSNNYLVGTVNTDAADWGGASATVNIGDSFKSSFSLVFKSTYIATNGLGDGVSILLLEKGSSIRCANALGGQILYLGATGTKGLVISFLANADAGKFNIELWTADGQGWHNGAEVIGVAKPSDGVYSVTLTPTSLTVNDTTVPAFSDIYAGYISAANINDADLTIGSVAAGTGTGSIEIRTVNGVAANLFGNGGGSVVPGPADIEVIAFAGAMIVALVAAAFVVKARKA